MMEAVPDLVGGGRWVCLPQVLDGIGALRLLVRSAMSKKKRPRQKKN